MVLAIRCMFRRPLPWAATLVALLGHPLWAVWLDSRYSIDLKSLYFLPDVRWWRPPPGWPWEWAIPTLGTPERRWLVALPFGGIAGLGLSMGLLRLGLIRRSFEDYDEWERETLASRGVPAPVPAPDPDRDDPARPSSSTDDPPDSADGLSTAAGDPSSVAEAHTAELSPPGKLDTPELWIQYPHARREMFKELVFLTPCLLGVVAAGFLAQAWFGGHRAMPPLCSAAQPPPSGMTW